METREVEKGREVDFSKPTKAAHLPGGATPLYGLYRYVQPKGYGFLAVLVINWVSILAILPPFWS